jgi:hypothetical protein
MGAHFLCINDRDPDAYARLFARARETEARDTLRGKTLGLLFDDTSPALRAAFTTAMSELGGKCVDVPPSASASAPAFAGLDAVVMRTRDEDRLWRFSAASPVPVIHGGSDAADPVQVLSDLSAVHATFGSLGRAMAFFGETGSSLARSLVEAGTVFRLYLRIVVPEGTKPDSIAVPHVLATADPSYGIGPVWAVLGDPTKPAPSPEVIARTRPAEDIIVVNALPARAQSHRHFLKALLEDILLSTPPARLADWRATRPAERVDIVIALHAIADARRKKDSNSNSDGYPPTVEVFAAKRRGDALVVSFLFHYGFGIWCQSGSDLEEHYVYTADATFAGGTCTGHVETSSAMHGFSEYQAETYDHDEAARPLRDAAIAKLLR